MRRAAIPILVAGAGWALLCLMLARGGHAPSVTLLPIPKQHYYLAQAGFVIPLLLGLWWLCVIVTHRVAKALGGSGNSAELARGIALALALPILLCVVVLDSLVYLMFGFEALARLLRVSAPIATVLTVAVATRTVRDTHALPTTKALLPALAGVIVQALVGGIALR